MSTDLRSLSERLLQSTRFVDVSFSFSLKLVSAIVVQFLPQFVPFPILFSFLQTFLDIPPVNLGDLKTISEIGNLSIKLR